MIRVFFESVRYCKDKTIIEENFHLEQDLLFDHITFAIWEKNDLVKKTCTLDVYRNLICDSGV